MDNLRAPASPLSSNAQSLGALAREWLRVACCLPGSAHTGAVDIPGLHQELLRLRSKVSINKYVSRAEGWAAAVKLSLQASALLTWRSLCTGLGNNWWSLHPWSDVFLAFSCRLTFLAPSAGRGSGQCPSCQDTGDVVHPLSHSRSPQATPSWDPAFVCFGCRC